MLKYLVTFLLMIGLGQGAHAGYEVTDNCKKAWLLMMDLKLDEAKALVADELKKTPDNYYLHYLDQTADAFKLIITSGDAPYNAFVENHNKRRKFMDNKFMDSPYYLYCSAEMALQVTVFSFLHGSQMSGVNKGVSAYKDLYKNIEKFPQFKPDKKLDGFFNVVIANLPPFARWALSMLNVKPNIKAGFKTLFDYYQSQKDVQGINAEAALYIILAGKINKTPEMLYDFTRTLDTTAANTFLHLYFRANIAYWSGKNEEAIRVLKRTDHDQNNYTGILYNYMMGKLMMRKLDPSAQSYFSRYLVLIQKKEYFKEINANLAFYWLINGDKAKYGKYMEVVRTKGMDVNERDREALYDASVDYTPDVNLVKAKFSLDGGYADAFKKSIAAFEAGHGKVPAYEMEYHLLKGRFAASSGNDNLAMAEFRKVLELGADADYYFASEAAMRLGEICRKLGQNSLAQSYYKQSQKLYQKDFYEYIEDKAKKGLASLGSS